MTSLTRKWMDSRWIDCIVFLLRYRICYRSVSCIYPFNTLIASRQWITHSCLINKQLATVTTVAKYTLYLAHCRHVCELDATTLHDRIMCNVCACLPSEHASTSFSLLENSDCSMWESSVLGSNPTNGSRGRNTLWNIGNNFCRGKVLNDNTILWFIRSV